MDSNENNSEGQKTTEISKVPQVEQAKPVDHLGTEAALNALNKETPGIPDRADLVRLAGTEPSNFNIGDDFDKTPIIDGKLASPTAVRVGEVGTKAAEQRGIDAAKVENAYESSINTKPFDIGTTEEEIEADKRRRRAEMPETEAPVRSFEKKDESVKITEDTTNKPENSSLNDDQIRGYLSEIDKQIPLVISGELSQDAFQTLLTFAKESGVPVDQLRNTLESKGVGVIQKEIAPAEKTKVDPILPSGKRATWVREGAVFDDNGNFSLGLAILGRMSRPGSQPLSGEFDPKADYSKRNNFGINIPEEIEQEAHRLAKETHDDTEYINYVGDKMGWKKDSQDGWIIPSEQIEKLSERQVIGIASGKEQPVELSTKKNEVSLEKATPTKEAVIPEKISSQDYLGLLTKLNSALKTARDSGDTDTYKRLLSVNAYGFGLIHGARSPENPEARDAYLKIVNELIK